MRIRTSLRDLQKTENKTQLNEFLKAWINIKELSPDHPDSFWTIAGYHGQPFQTRDDVDPYWGGYCQHANVLFPTWHRMYVKRLEDALNNHKSQYAIDNGIEIGMHYWDEISEESLNYPLKSAGEKGIPDLLLIDKVILTNADGCEVEVDNPLKSYVFQKAINGTEASDKEIYDKEIGYETCRYPYSGITSPPDQHDVAMEHNNSIINPILNLELNVWYALRVDGRFSNNEGSNPDPPVESLFKCSLETPTYNQFSNVLSASTVSNTISLEQPHNDMHLATGGFDYGPDSYGLIRGANGDMGANEVAAFDPMFFFHHCFIDLMLWRWQQNHNQQEEIEIIHDANDPGLKTTGAGPTPGQDADDVLSADTKLYPFYKPGSDTEFATTKDCANVETQLNYAYKLYPYRAGKRFSNQWKFKELSLEDFVLPRKKITFRERERFFIKVGNTKREISKIVDYLANAGPTLLSSSTKQFWLIVDGINCDKYPGSFLVKAYHRKLDRLVLVTQQGVLNRWNRKICANCQKHPEVSLTFKLTDKDCDPTPSLDAYEVHIIHKDVSTKEHEKIIKITSQSRLNDTSAPVFRFMFVINP